MNETDTIEIPIVKAMRVMNLLANLGIALEGTVIEIEEAPDDPMFRITPRDIHEAWLTMHTAFFPKEVSG